MLSLAFLSLEDSSPRGELPGGSATWVASSVPADFLGLPCCRPGSPLHASWEGRGFVLPHETIYMWAYGVHKPTRVCTCVGMNPVRMGAVPTCLSFCVNFLKPRF